MEEFLAFLAYIFGLVKVYIGPNHEYVHRVSELWSGRTNFMIYDAHGKAKLKVIGPYCIGRCCDLKEFHVIFFFLFAKQSIFNT